MRRAARTFTPAVTKPCGANRAAATSLSLLHAVRALKPCTPNPETLFLALQEAPPLPSAAPDPHYSEKPRGLSCAAVAKSYRRSGRDAAAARQGAKKVCCKRFQYKTNACVINPEYSRGFRLHW